MDSSFKTIAVILLLFIGICAGRDAKGFRNVVNPTNPSTEVIVEMKMRDLTEIDVFVDYVKPIPNPRHEKGKPGGGANK
ncbi:hypothetical protein ABKV19_011710 [Rosa sericea]